MKSNKPHQHVATIKSDGETLTLNGKPCCILTACVSAIRQVAEDQDDQALVEMAKEMAHYLKLEAAD